MKEMDDRLLVKMRFLNMEIKQRNAKNNIQQAIYASI